MLRLALPASMRRTGCALALGVALATLCSGPAHAALFEDDEARRAILDLRQKVEQLTQASEAQRTRGSDATAQLTEQVSQLKRSLLDLNNQLELLRAENAKLRGQDEQLQRDLAEVQRKQKDMQSAVDERVRALEPQKVQVDGREFVADPDEKRAFDDALAQLRKGDFAAAGAAFAAFDRRYPASGFRPSVLYWWGNAQYGKRDYKDAITTFRAMVSGSPEHPRAAEALLSLANCQIELKDSKAARKTLDELVKAYPASEAAQAGRERLAALK
jgi:tol-pal system protein YbgF